MEFSNSVYVIHALIQLVEYWKWTQKGSCILMGMGPSPLWHGRLYLDFEPNIALDKK